MSTSDKQMTDAERLALADKLDHELDDFINGLEKRGYTEGWPEDRWEEEMDKHPFFMKNAPTEEDELSPLMKGLQMLKYDKNENTAQEMADTYKEDGNFYVKHKKYRMAILSYTEGLRQQFNNDQLKATLHNNRSAAQFFLKNYRSAIKDAQKAITLKPDYQKALVRIAHCEFSLNKFLNCVNICNEILVANPNDQKVLELKKNSLAKERVRVEKVRRIEIHEKLKKSERARVLNAIRKRGIKIAIGQTEETLMKPTYMPLEGHPVSLEKETLLWPTVFLYPEYMTSEFHEQLSEDVRMNDCLEMMFTEPASWDTKRVYLPKNLNVYYESYQKVYPVNKEATIKEITQETNFTVNDGCLKFTAVVKNSVSERQYLDSVKTKSKS